MNGNANNYNNNYNAYNNNQQYPPYPQQQMSPNTMGMQQPNMSPMQQNNNFAQSMPMQYNQNQNNFRSDISSIPAKNIDNAPRGPIKNPRFHQPPSVV